MSLLIVNKLLCYTRGGGKVIITSFSVPSRSRNRHIYDVTKNRRQSCFPAHFQLYEAQDGKVPAAAAAAYLSRYVGANMLFPSSNDSAAWEATFSPSIFVFGPVFLHVILSQ
jgi:hypothetical protein